MNTKDRILDISLTLFNEEGEASQTAVDIANAIDISPGNLYYHFKGKDAIIRALFDRFEDEMFLILRGSRGRIASIEDNWVYTYILLEEIYDFRFFYRDLSVLLARYPDLATRFRALVREMSDTIEDTLSSLEAAGWIEIDPRLRALIVEQILSTLTFWLSRDAVFAGATAPQPLMHRTVLQVIAQLVPHMGRRGEAVLSGLLAYYDRVVSDAETAAEQSPAAF